MREESRRRPEALEVNFDGLVGPTHHYGGLSFGNLASMGHGGLASNPRAAALQGLAKMRLLLGLGIRQGVLPPQERPDMASLRALGFHGSDAQVLEGAARQAPELLAACSSASAMWAANAATVSPAADAADGRVHLTPANLVTQFHRSLESDATARLLRLVFPDEAAFCHHPPLPASVATADEGAANHLRLCAGHGGPGVEVFVYGRSAFAEDEAPRRFPARQTLEASQAVARRHRLDPARVEFARQSPEVVERGVFHNDVICVANENTLFFHERAFAETFAVARIREAFGRCAGEGPVLVGVTEKRLPVAEAVATYLFNSQLVSRPGGGMALLAPAECRESAATRGVLEEVLAGDNPIEEVHYAEVRQSMRNGGGPACLRLRVVLTREELAAVHPGALFTEDRDRALVAWVERHYRDRLAPADLGDSRLLDESRAALDELTRLLGLGSLYPFQREAG